MVGAGMFQWLLNQAHCSLGAQNEPWQEVLRPHSVVQNQVAIILKNHQCLVASLDRKDPKCE